MARTGNGTESTGQLMKSILSPDLMNVTCRIGPIGMHFSSYCDHLYNGKRRGEPVTIASQADTCHGTVLGY